MELPLPARCPPCGQRSAWSAEAQAACVAPPERTCGGRQADCSTGSGCSQRSPGISLHSTRRSSAPPTAPVGCPVLDDVSHKTTCGRANRLDFCFVTDAVFRLPGPSRQSTTQAGAQQPWHLLVGGSWVRTTTWLPTAALRQAQPPVPEAPLSAEQPRTQLFAI